MGRDGHLSAVEGLPRGSALLVVKRGPNAGARFLLDRPITSAGRNSGSDVVLDDVTVSGRHAEFRWENDELQVVDVGSLYGTYVNREWVESATLANGEQNLYWHILPGCIEIPKRLRAQGKPCYVP
jgi:pSer/pThr/pTyr-binding forkhead associated (FHA) protein